jgi:hypothetical protein
MEKAISCQEKNAHEAKKNNPQYQGMKQLEGNSRKTSSYE